MEKKSLKKRLPDAWKNFKAAFNVVVEEIPGVFVWIILAIVLLVASIAGLITAEKPNLQVIGSGPVAFKSVTTIVEINGATSPVEAVITKAFVEINGSVFPVDVVITKAKTYDDGQKCIVTLDPKEGMEVTAFTQRPSAQPEFLLGKGNRDDILNVTNAVGKYQGLQAVTFLCVFIGLLLLYFCRWAIKNELKKKKEAPAPDADS